MRVTVAIALFVLFVHATGTYARPPLHKLLHGKAASNIWVLIVAGSNTWMNYRHQV